MKILTTRYHVLDDVCMYSPYHIIISFFDPPLIWGDWPKSVRWFTRIAALDGLVVRVSIFGMAVVSGSNPRRVTPQIQTCRKITGVVLPHCKPRHRVVIFFVVVIIMIDNAQTDYTTPRCRLLIITNRLRINCAWRLWWGTIGNMHSLTIPGYNHHFSPEAGSYKKQME